MNDTAQKPSDQPASQVPTIVNTPSQFSVSPNREQEPAPFPDVTTMTEAEIQQEEKEVEKELEAIVERSPKDQQPVIDEEIKKVGVALSEEDIKEQPISIGVQPLPMTFGQAKVIRQKNNWRSSISWLAALVMYHWKKLQHSKE